tara:strand:+ start:496 stop:852 length:357 start_codon:yes stop_codon:yes gene_type:complete
MVMHSSLIADQTLGMPIPHRQVLRDQKVRQVLRESVARQAPKAIPVLRGQQARQVRKVPKATEAYPEQTQLSQALRGQRVIRDNLDQKVLRVLKDRKVQRDQKALKVNPVQVSSSKEL